MQKLSKFLVIFLQILICIYEKKADFRPGKLKNSVLMMDNGNSFTSSNYIFHLPSLGTRRSTKS